MQNSFEKLATEKYQHGMSVWITHPQGHKVPGLLLFAEKSGLWYFEGDGLVQWLLHTEVFVQKPNA